ncbi:MAG: hypothetical protein GC164_06725 [Phycisphaera sp.]|nr:hypothetical protein [Phycisphaera sp.]
MILRTIGAMGLVVLLLNPGRWEHEPVARDRQVRLDILVDTSESMAVDDADRTGRQNVSGEALRASRLDAVNRDWLEGDARETFAQLPGVRLRTFARKLSTPTGVAPVASDQTLSGGTALWTSVQSAAHDVGGGGRLLLLTDGRDTTGRGVGALASALGASGVRVDAVCVGGDVVRRRATVSAELMGDRLFAGEAGELDAVVRSVGLSGASGSITWQCGEQTHTQNLRIEKDGEQRVRLPITHDKAGLYVWSVTLGGLGEGVPTAASRLEVRVEGRSIRVLIADGRPSWDTRFLARALQRDRRVLLTWASALQDGRVVLNTTDQRENGNGQPTGKASLEPADYGVVILGDDPDRVLGSGLTDRITAYLDGGGRVVLMNAEALGDAPWSLRVMEPSLPGSRPVTRSADNHPIWEALRSRWPRERVTQELPTPWGMVRGVQPADNAKSLWNIKGVPFWGERPYGRGIVMAVNGRGLWRWATHNADRPETAGFFDAWWSAVVRYLVSVDGFTLDHGSTLDFSPASPVTGQAVDILVQSQSGESNAPFPSLNVIDEKNKSESIPLQPSVLGGLYKTSWTPVDAGGYRFVLKDHTGVVSDERRLWVQTDENETLDLSSDPASLQSLVQATGGRMWNLDEAQAFVQSLSTSGSDATPRGPGRFTPMWDRGWVLTVIALAWCASWWLSSKGED